MSRIEALFQVRDLSVPWLEPRLTFSLTPSRGCFLSGPNGIGKSSFMRTFAGLNCQFSGVLFQASEVSYIGHDYFLHDVCNVSFILKFWDAENIFMLPKNLCVGNLSFGQKRMLALSIVLNPAKKIWILDEPELGLDNSASKLLVGFIEDFLRNGGAVIISSHCFELYANLSFHGIDLASI